MEFNESPLFMLLDPVSKGLSTKKKLPIVLFESELHVLNGSPTMLFVKTPFKVETSETEGISVDHISKIAPIGDSSKSSCQCALCALLRVCARGN
jgi:COP9 signalosome complex subunit 6